MNIFVLALRNVMRNRRRSAATLLAMILGLCAVLLFGGYARNINYSLQTNFVQRSGHLQVQHKDYFLYGSGRPAAYGIDHYARVMEVIRTDPVLASMLTVVTPVLQVNGIAGNFEAGVSHTVRGIGVVVEEQNELRRWNDYGFPARAAASRMALTGTEPDAAMVGSGVARILQICAPLHVQPCEASTPSSEAHAAQSSTPADLAALASDQKTQTASISAGVPVELLTASVSGAPNVTRLGVVKAEEQGVKELDDVMLTMHLEQAQRLVYGNSPAHVTAIIVQLRHTAQQGVARARLQALLDEHFAHQKLEVQDFQKLNPFYGQSISMFGAIFAFISMLMVTLVLFSVGNTMSMAIVERTAEIGTLRAMGMQRSGVRRLFLTESLLLGGLGAVLGVILSLILAWVVNRAGLTWLPPGRTEPVALSLRLWGEWWLIGSAAMGLMVVAIFSVWWPARRAACMRVVDALRHV